MGTKAYFFQGKKSASVSSYAIDIYDNTTDTWTPTTSPVYAGTDPQYVASEPWAVFGRGANVVSGKIYIYNNITGEITLVSNPYDRFDYELAILGHKVYFAGGKGQDFGTVTNQVNIYDLETGEWSLDTLSQARGEIKSVVVGQKIFFIGGVISIGQSLLSKVVDVYDADTDTWSAFNLSEGKKAFGVAVSGNKIVIAGGQPSSNLAQPYMSKKVDIINVTNNTITAIANLSMPNAYMESAVVGNKVVFAGGLHSKAEILNLTNNTWSTFQLPTTATTFDFQSSASLGNEAFFAGGELTGNSVFIYNATTNMWSTYTLPSYQIAPAVITIGNKVMIAGGRTLSGLASNKISIYTNSSIVDAPELLVTQGVQISPNPSSGIFHIEGDFIRNSNTTLTVTDMTGRVVLHQPFVSNELDLSTCAAGIYQVKLSSDKGISSQLIVKQ